MNESGHLLEVLAAVGRQDNPGNVTQPLLDRFHRLQLVLYDNQYSASQSSTFAINFSLYQNQGP
jgi:hypothetical protein